MAKQKLTQTVKMYTDRDEKLTGLAYRARSIKDDCTLNLKVYIFLPFNMGNYFARKFSMQPSFIDHTCEHTNTETMLSCYNYCPTSRCK